MEDGLNYYEDGVARILKLMRDRFGDYFKTYYDDDIGDIPEANLPCLMVRETGGTIAPSATGTDQIVEQVVIIVSMNSKDDLGARTNQDLTGAKLRRIVKGQYPEGHANAGQYHQQSIMHVLSTHYTLSDGIISREIQTEFDVAQRGANTYTKEAYVTVTISRLAMVPARD